MALKSLRTAAFALRTKDARVDIEHENMYGALNCDDDDDDHNARDPNPSTQLVEHTILKAIDDAMDREHALGALGGWVKVKGPCKAKSPKHQNANRLITVEIEHDLVNIFALPSGPQSDEARIAATQMVPVYKS